MGAAGALRDRSVETDATVTARDCFQSLKVIAAIGAVVAVRFAYSSVRNLRPEPHGQDDAFTAPDLGFGPGRVPPLARDAESGAARRNRDACAPHTPSSYAGANFAAPSLLSCCRCATKSPFASSLWRTDPDPVTLPARFAPARTARRTSRSAPPYRAATVTARSAGRASRRAVRTAPQSVSSPSCRYSSACRP
jgi:hypothetical protein